MEGLADGFALRVQHAVLQHDGDDGFHAAVARMGKTVPALADMTAVAQ
jgi:hypothetical protein